MFNSHTHTAGTLQTSYTAGKIDYRHEKISTPPEPGPKPPELGPELPELIHVVTWRDPDFLRGLRLPTGLQQKGQQPEPGFR